MAFKKDNLLILMYCIGGEVSPSRGTFVVEDIDSIKQYTGLENFEVDLERGTWCLDTGDVKIGVNCAGIPDSKYGIIFDKPKLPGRYILGVYDKTNIRQLNDMVRYVQHTHSLQIKKGMEELINEYFI